MKRIFGMFKQPPQEKKKVLLITNFQQCKMGMSLANRFRSVIDEEKESIYDQMVLVSPKASDSEF